MHTLLGKSSELKQYRNFFIGRNIDSFNLEGADTNITQILTEFRTRK